LSCSAHRQRPFRGSSRNSGRATHGTRMVRTTY
jgi:hypothetical protein